MTALDLHHHRWEPAAIPNQPTLLLLHGTGGDENDLIPLARAMAPNAALLSVRGNVLEHGAPRFFRRLAEGVFDIPDLHKRTAALSEFIGAAKERYEFHANSLYALGFSNGANIAASLLFTHPAALAGGLLIRAMVPFEPEKTPPLDGKHVLVSAGQSDHMIPRAGTERLVELLRSAGASVDLEWQAASHGLVPGDVKAAQRFLESLVKH